MRGRYFNPKAVHKHQARAPRFKPDGRKKFTLFDPSVAIRGNKKFCACLDCGFLWSRASLHKTLETTPPSSLPALYPLRHALCSSIEHNFVFVCRHHGIPAEFFLKVFVEALGGFFLAVNNEDLAGRLLD